MNAAKSTVLLWLALFCYSSASIAHAQAKTRARQPASVRWVVDSARDAMTDTWSVTAILRASETVRTAMGGFRPALVIVCRPGASRPEDIIDWFIWTAEPPNVSSANYLTYTYVMYRFDEEAPREQNFSFDAIGEGYRMEPHLMSGDPDPLLPRLATASRLLFRFGLLFGNTVTAEFRFPANTRSAMRRVFNACDRVAPGDSSVVPPTQR